MQHGQLTTFWTIFAVTLIVCMSISCLVTIARADTGTASDNQTPATITDSNNAPASALLPQGSNNTLLPLTTCQNVTWQETDRAYTTCSDQYNLTHCASDNTTCTITTQVETYPCANGTTTTTKTRTDCTTDGYLINNGLQLNTTGYSCSATEDGKLYLTCDSKYDGNGDGICTSGESCMRISIVGTYATLQERDSQDTFLDYDSTFNLPPITIANGITSQNG